ncbi:MAG TPA: O-antigen ligase family protein [Solirubrobacteraceae bacterium]|nr:O-antigen ligase family protein [Solirubrobacteraceae bacterium]
MADGAAQTSGVLLRPARRAASATTAIVALGLLAAGLTRGFEAADPSLPVALAAGLAAIAILALTIARYDAAVALGFLLMAVVEIEPAPPDAVFAVIIAVAIATGRFGASRAPISITLPIAAFVLMNAASMLASVELPVALRFSLITVYLAVLALWLAGWLDSARRARILVVTWLLVAVASALLGIAVVYVGIPGAEILMDGTQTRANVLFEDANVYGPFLVPIAAILLEERLRPQLLRLRGFVIGALFLILALGVVVSFSRAGWINFVVATLVMLSVVALRRRGGRRALRMLVMLVVAGVAVLAVMQSTGSLGFFEERAQLQSYDTERFTAQRAGIDLATSHAAGVGPGQFRFYHSLEAHSTYVRVLAEQGVVGLLAWLALIGVTLGLAVANALAGRDTFGIGSAALLGAWCGLLVNSAVVDTLHWRHLWVVAALIWAGSVSAGSPRPTPAGRPPRVEVRTAS